jgi:hypothetical protein
MRKDGDGPFVNFPFKINRFSRQRHLTPLKLQYVTTIYFFLFFFILRVAFGHMEWPSTPILIKKMVKANFESGITTPMGYGLRKWFGYLRRVKWGGQNHFHLACLPMVWPPNGKRSKKKKKKLFIRKGMWFIW